MLYIIKRQKDSYYLEVFKEDKSEIVFTPLKSDALQLPQNVAERYVESLREVGNEVYNVIPAINIKDDYRIRL